MAYEYEFFEKLDKIVLLLERIAAAVENLDGDYDEGGGIIALLNAENVQEVLKEVKFPSTQQR